MFSYSSTTINPDDTLALNAVKGFLALDNTGFLNHISDDLTEIINYCSTQLADKKQLNVVGMGGSSLGAQCLTQALNKNNKEILYWNNSDPKVIREMLKLDSQGHYLFTSKSGRTIETLSMANLILEDLKQSHRPWAENITVISEQETPLFKWAQKNSIQTFEHPNDIGGRFSIFTSVSLIPATFVGANIQQLLLGARRAIEAPNLAAQIIQDILLSFEKNKSISSFWTYEAKLQYFTYWLEQLWAESLGKLKNRKGEACPNVSTPTVHLGTRDQHSVQQQIIEGKQDKFVTFFRNLETEQVKFSSVENHFHELSWLNHPFSKIYTAQVDATIEAMSEKGVMNSSITFQKIEEEELGFLLMTYMICIGTIGEVLDIDVFNQPGVELGKTLAKSKLTINEI